MRSLVVDRSVADDEVAVERRSNFVTGHAGNKIQLWVGRRILETGVEGVDYLELVAASQRNVAAIVAVACSRDSDFPHSEGY